ncbi:MAG TPA: hypothetical protein VL793_05570 [Patescibacteria group bacterium]|nr:hypothetical protein [Patescibacteria group bacterium]
MSTNEIENILRRAPQPKPPGNLQQQLKAHALSVPRVPCPEMIVPRDSGSWLSRWWAALAPTVVTLACAATLTAQRKELQQLQSGTASGLSAVPVVIPGGGATQIAPDAQTASVAPGEELARLRNLIAALQADIAKLEQIRAENDKLRAQLSARSAAVFSPDETKAMEDARDRALRIECVNNLKQLGLAVRVWALDHQELAPPDVLSMSNQIPSFKILICPADTGRQPATDWTTYSAANCSYEFLGAQAPDTEPQRIVFRCPIHGSLGLIDGSAQMSIAKSHPNWIVQRNGKYYMEVPFAERGDNPASQESSNPNQ